MKDLGLGGLRITKIQHFIEELINDDKVIPDTLFFQLFEIFCEDFHNAVEEEEDFGRIGILFRQGQQIEVVMSDVEVVDAFVREARWYGGGLFFGFRQENGELLDGAHGNVSAVVARQEGLALEVEEEDRRGHVGGGGGGGGGSGVWARGPV